MAGDPEGSVWLPAGWSWPRALLVALALAVVLTGLVAASTSATAFGSYNPAWDGASQLSEIARDAGGDPLVALQTAAYAESDPQRTVAVVLSPDTSYDGADRGRLSRFVRRGGTLVVAEDYGPHADPLLAAVGAETRFDGAPLRDERRYSRSPAFPVAPNVSEGPATAGVDRLTLNHPTSLRVEDGSNATVLVRSSEFAYLDRNRNGSLDSEEELAARPVVVRERVGNGTVYAVSDPSLFVNAMLEQSGNARFGRNLVGNASTVLLDQSHLRGQPPLAVARHTLRASPALQLLVGALGVGAVALGGRLRRGLRGLRRVGGRLTPGPDRRRQRSPETEPPALTDADPEAVVAYLARRNPDWDEDRLRRVMRGVLRGDAGGSDDE